MTRTAIRFDTNKYLLSHGRAPKGYGLWMFQVRGVTAEAGQFSSTGTYTQARADVSREIRARVGTIIPRDVFNSLTVDVLP